MFRRFIYMIEKNFELKRSFDNNKDITKDDIDLYIKQGATIIDVRSPQEYSEGHLDGAILLSEYEVNKKYKNYLKDKEEKIVVYCSSGVRSKKAQKSLIKKGYKKVYNLLGGIEKSENW